MKWEDVLAFLKSEVANAEVGVKGIVTKLGEALPEVRQAIYRAGVARGKEDAKTETATLKTRAEEAEGQVETLNGEITTLKGANKDISQLTRDHDTKILTLTTKHTTDMKAKDAEIRELALDNARANFARAASDDKVGGMHAVYAENLFDKMTRDGRVKVEGKTVTLLEADKITPYVPGEDEHGVFGAAARDERKRAPDEMLRVKLESGTGTSTAIKGGGGGTGAAAGRYDAIREAEKKDREATTIGGGTAAERMGMVRK